MRKLNRGGVSGGEVNLTRIFDRFTFLLRSKTGYLLFAGVALLFFSFGITRRAGWNDEAATISSANRPVGQLVLLVHHVDVVHFLYYLFMHFWIQLFGESIFSVRFPSAIAMALSAGLLVALGKSFFKKASVAYCAGIIFIFMPTVHRYASEARSYSFQALMAIVIFLLTSRLAQRNRQGLSKLSSWRLYVAQLIAVTVVFIAAIMLNIFSVFLIVPLVMLSMVSKNKKFVYQHATALMVGILICLPLIFCASQNSSQVDWVGSSSHGFAVVKSFFVQIWAEKNIGVALILWILAAAAVRGFLRKHNKRDQNNPYLMAFLALVLWAIMPAVPLILLSVLKPLYYYRYCVMSTPAMTLIAAYGLHVLNIKSIIRGLILVIFCGASIPSLLNNVSINGQGTENYYQVANFISVSKNVQKPEGILYGYGKPGSTARVISVLYPENFYRLNDPLKTGNLDNGFYYKNSPIAQSGAQLMQNSCLFIIDSSEDNYFTQSDYDYLHNLEFASKEKVNFSGISVNKVCRNN